MMKFEDALVLLRAGKKVRRQVWGAAWMSYQDFVQYDAGYGNGREIWRGTIPNFRLRPSDLEAEDWEEMG